MVTNLPANAGDLGSLGQEELLERQWQPAPGFLPGKSHGQRSLVGYSLQGCKRVRHDLETKQPRFFKNCKHLIFFNVRFEGLCSHEMQLGAE